MNAFVRLLYAVLLAAVVVAFTNISIYTFYQQPKEPKYPTYAIDKSDTAVQKQEAEYQKNYDTYRDTKLKPYQRNVSIALIVVAAVVVAIGYVLMRDQEVLGEGLALGGMATFVSAIISASIADNRVTRFIAVTLLLVFAVLLIRKRFVAVEPTAKK
jgi:hypothetical protein